MRSREKTDADTMSLWRNMAHRNRQQLVHRFLD